MCKKMQFLTASIWTPSITCTEEYDISYTIIMHLQGFVIWCKHFQRAQMRFCQSQMYLRPAKSKMADTQIFTYIYHFTFWKSKYISLLSWNYKSYLMMLNIPVKAFLTVHIYMLLLWDTMLQFKLRDLCYFTYNILSECQKLENTWSEWNRSSTLPKMIEHFIRMKSV